MAGQTTTNLPAKRKGPMSPEEMVDVRNQELRVDEEMVVRLVEEAKADYGVNLLEPHQLYMGGSGSSCRLSCATGSASSR